jgi:hypothetical protein
MSVRPVMARGSHDVLMVTGWGGLPMRMKYWVSTTGSPSVMPRRVAISAGAVVRLLLC